VIHRFYANGLPISFLIAPNDFRPLGYKVRAEILDYPHGNLGDVGIYLVW
jgi:hypothetical protein